MVHESPSWGNNVPAVDIARGTNDIGEFQASVDAYKRSLGTPVLNLDITEVEGILVRGTRDFTVDYGDGIICMRPERCSDGEGCPAWADVSRTTTFSSPLPSYAVRLGPDTKNLQLVVSGLVCPSWKPSGLAVGTTYYCAVIAHHHAGEVAGPLWTFKTKP